MASSSTTRLPYQLGVAAFVGIFALGIAQALRQEHSLPPLGNDQLSAARDLFAAGDSVSATAQLRMFASIEGNKPDGWVRLGQVLMATGDRAGAIQAFERAIRYLPDPAIAHAQLATLYLEAGRRDAAREQAIAARRAGAPLAPELETLAAEGQAR